MHRHHIVSLLAMEFTVGPSGIPVGDVAFEDSPGAGTSFYYLRVVQSNGERAWSTPIWVVAGG